VQPGIPGASPAEVAIHVKVKSIEI
jgi:hypothetical protein